MRTIVIACALLLLGACHTSPRVATAEESHTRVHAVRTLRLDSSALFAIVEIDSPRLTLSPDTARPRIALSGRRMRAAVARTAVAVEAAAILPCFWVYLEVGKHILSIARLDGNPYADWIRAYSDPAFEASNARAIEICDQLAEAATPEVRARMTDIFLQCTRLEWLFWHSAYEDLRWPLPLR